MRRRRNNQTKLIYFTEKKLAAHQFVVRLMINKIIQPITSGERKRGLQRPPHARLSQLTCLHDCRHNSLHGRSRLFSVETRNYLKQRSTPPAEKRKTKKKTIRTEELSDSITCLTGRHGTVYRCVLAILEMVYAVTSERLRD